MVYCRRRMDKTQCMKWLLLAAALVLATSALVVLFRKPDEPRSRPGQVVQANTPTALMEGMRAAEFRQGVKRWDLTAVRAEYDKERDHTVLTDVTLIAAGNTSHGTVNLVAPVAEYMNGTKNMRLTKGVTGKGDRQMRFAAGQALFSNASSLLTARDQVRYEDDRLKVSGDEMLFDLETRNLRLQRNVRATINPRRSN
jgi:LPS export ABC transporter protein LptC